jgi:hypothetical protein
MVLPKQARQILGPPRTQQHSSQHFQKKAKNSYNPVRNRHVLHLTRLMPMACIAWFLGNSGSYLVDVLGVEILGLSLGQHDVAAVKQVSDLWSFHWAPHLPRGVNFRFRVGCLLLGVWVSKDHDTQVNDSM